MFEETWQNLPIHYHFNRHNIEIQNALASKRRTLLSWKAVNRLNLVPLMSDEAKTFSGSLGVDLRIL